MTTRHADDVLARARLASLVGTLAEGTKVELLRPELQRHGLGIHLTEPENAWFWSDEAPGAEHAWQHEAMLALAWALGLLDALGARDPLAYGAVQETLDDESLADLALRPEDELRAMLASIEQVMAEGEAPTPNERFGRDCLAWRRHALAWVLGQEPVW